MKRTGRSERAQSERLEIDRTGKCEYNRVYLKTTEVSYFPGTEKFDCTCRRRLYLAPLICYSHSNTRDELKYEKN